MNTADIKNEKSVRYHGVGISNGCVSGPLRFFRQRRKMGRIRACGDQREERARFEQALLRTREQLDTLQRRAIREIGKKEAEIFEIHAMMLEDEDFLEAVQGALDDGACAETAVERAAEKHAQALRSLGDPYLSARAEDLHDVATQLLRQLSGERPDGDLSTEREPYILVADDLSPSETVTMEKSMILGFVTFGGTPNSHTSILARAMGIPALVGVGAVSEDCDGAYALLDAAEGTLTVSPDAEERCAFEEKQREVNDLAREHDRYLRSLINKPAITRSGRKILIYANVGEGREIAQALLNGADGVGLLRSEFLYLSMDRYPTEDELFASYHDVVQSMQGKRIVIRTLDIGADKQIPYFALPQEENPALGFRGVRICLAREEIFKTQLRAILRASAYGNVSVMVPMIVSEDEVRACRVILNECMEELEREGKKFDHGIEFGIMIETPAAAIMSDEIAREVDFFSVGTNDLTQYTLAADRQNPLVERICEENREPILRLIEMAAEAIHRHDGWIGICGELAADLHLTQRFIDLGIDELSVSVPYLLGVREKVTECK
ncbi:MAG: phosphoenolpyruvate--protein phosphotransferase [Clostridia bacterium]|nr:phosphoenolpyruvate--protein phosphotransferase [Clostridia bacterium]